MQPTAGVTEKSHNQHRPETTCKFFISFISCRFFKLQKSFSKKSKSKIISFFRKDTYLSEKKKIYSVPGPHESVSVSGSRPDVAQTVGELGGNTTSYTGKRAELCSGTTSRHQAPKTPIRLRNYTTRNYNHKYGLKVESRRDASRFILVIYLLYFDTYVHVHLAACSRDSFASACASFIGF